MKKLIEYIKLWVKSFKKEYRCPSCKDTGEIWAGLSGCDIIKCDCKSDESK